MKTFRKSMMSKGMVALLSIGGAINAMANQPVEVNVPVDHVYSPKGFDSNDESEIIISGHLPNLCYRTPKSSSKIVGNKIEITVSSFYHNPAMFCAEAIVPFVEVVKVGVLDKGQYEIVVNKATPYEAKSDIAISESISGAQDDFVYANVDHIEKNLGDRNIKIKGYNPSDCFVFDKVDVVSNNKDTLSILPKMKQVSDFCPLKMVPFEYDFEVPRVENEKTILLHVRSMEGRSVNSLFEQVDLQMNGVHK